VSRLLAPLLLLLAFGVAFAANTFGASMLGFDDHPGQLYRVWHVMTSGPAPWAWNRGWWAGYPELQFYPPGAAYLTALVAWPAQGVISVETAYLMVLWLAYLLPGVTAYVAVARLVGSGWLALPAGFVALTLDAGLASGVEGGVHIGMIGARLAWALLPVLLWALRPWIDDERPIPIVVPIILAAIVLLHPAQLPAAVGLVVLAACARPPRRVRALAALGTLASAAALSAFWTLPLLARLAETRALAWGTLGIAEMMRPVPLVLLGLAVIGLSWRVAVFPSERVALWWLPAAASITLVASRRPLPALRSRRRRRVDGADRRGHRERSAPGTASAGHRPGPGSRRRRRIAPRAAVGARCHSCPAHRRRVVAAAPQRRAGAAAARLLDGAQPAPRRSRAVRAIRRAARARGRLVATPHACNRVDADRQRPGHRPWHVHPPGAHCRARLSR
jgi:hypothetical protein